MDQTWFTNKLFWCLGATSGIGYAVCQELAQKKVRLIISARKDTGFEEKKKELLTLGASEVKFVPFDMKNDDPTHLTESVLQGEKLNGVLLNAGGPKSGKLLTLNYEDFLDANKLILAGPARFLSSCLKYLEPQNSSVVSITSTSVKEPVGELNLSAIYRSALVVFLKNLAHELGHLGIRINNVGPGATATDHLNHMIELNAEKKGLQLKDELKSWNSRAAFNRLGKPEEIAKLVTFLFSNDASFVNGQTILADGCSTKSYF